ncbi:OmpA family protein [Serratia fonticola]|uniref:OmpA family protein n=1 Tax=Serratia fonticola TaxID=47917 RepID=UPI00217B6290|nr:OmpA family protein [Serratia fonticola]CAI1542596.1 Outer membrane protein II [Serratia fonticola]CAI1656189.1 Outer membrane protein II [Serratia fonticola]CAI1869712.1 Outer membrane protein II [Serratia fonticola]
MFSFSKSARVVLAAAIVLSMSACTRSISQVDNAGHTANPVFPQMDNATRKEGSYVNLDNLKMIKPGMTKNQLYQLIGAPHFSEGVFGVKEWDYILKFRMASGNDLVCQYKVVFDKDLIAQSFFFQPENCLDKLQAAPAVVKHEAPSSPVTFNANMMFGFNSAVLSAAGVNELTGFANKIKQTNLNEKSIIIIGHTDRLGSKAYNQQLSLKRAESVRDLLVSNGISRQIIQVEGAGASEPLVACPGKKSAKVVECLAPNRRIVIEFTSK